MHQPHTLTPPQASLRRAPRWVRPQRWAPQAPPAGAARLRFAAGHPRRRPCSFDGRALEIAAKIAEMSPIYAQMIKAEILMTYEKPLDDGLSLERKLLLWQTEDHDEGIAAFVKKRKPRFTGR